MTTNDVSFIQALTSNWEIVILVAGLIATWGETRVKLQRLIGLHTPEMLIEQTREIATMRADIAVLQKMAEDRRQDVKDIHAKIERQ